MKNNLNLHMALVQGISEVWDRRGGRLRKEGSFEGSE